MGNVSIVISGPSFNIHSYSFKGKRVMDIKQSNITITTMDRLKYAITYLSLNNTSVFGCVFFAFCTNVCMVNFRRCFCYPTS